MAHSVYEIWLKYNNKRYLFCHPNQCDSVETGQQLHYDYLNSISLCQMCPELKTSQYIEKCGRYDIKTHFALKYFLKNGYIIKKKDGKPAKKEYLTSYANSTRIDAIWTKQGRWLIKNVVKDL